MSEFLREDCEQQLAKAAEQWQWRTTLYGQETCVPPHRLYATLTRSVWCCLRCGHTTPCRMFMSPPATTTKTTSATLLGGADELREEVHAVLTEVPRPARCSRVLVTLDVARLRAELARLATRVLGLEEALKPAAVHITITDDVTKAWTASLGVAPKAIPKYSLAAFLRYVYRTSSQPMYYDDATYEFYLDDPASGICRFDYRDILFQFVLTQIKPESRDKYERMVAACRHEQACGCTDIVPQTQLRSTFRPDMLKYVGGRMTLDYIPDTCGQPTRRIPT